MNAKERLDAFYAGKPVDRLPNLTIVGTAEEFLEVVDVLHGSPYVIQTFDPDQRELMEKVLKAR